MWSRLAVESGRDISARPSGPNRPKGRATQSRAGLSYAVRVGSGQVGPGQATLFGSGQVDSGYVKPGRARPCRTRMVMSGQVGSDQTCTWAEMSRLDQPLPDPTRPGPTRIDPTRPNPTQPTQSILARPESIRPAANGSVQTILTRASGPNRQTGQTKPARPDRL